MSSPPQTTYVEGQPRSVSEWTPSMLRTAIRMSDGGSLRMAADLCDQLLADGRISGVLGVRVRGLVRLPIRFESEAGDDSEEATPEEEALAVDFWRSFPENDLVELCSWAVLLGVGIGEHVWTERDGRMLPTLKVWHPRWLRYDWPTREWMLTVDGGKEIVITPGDGKWFLYTPYGKSRPWAHAPWKALGLTWIVKQFAVGDFASSSEAHGKAARVGTAPEGANADTRTKFAADLRALMGGGAIALPPGYDFKLVEAMSQSWQQFPALISYSDTAASITLSGQNLSTEVTGGSFAATSVHAAIGHHLVESDEQTLSTALHEQSLTWWTEFNFGDRTRTPWARWDVTPPEDKAASAATLSAVGTAASALQLAGMPVDWVELGRRYDIPLSDDPLAGLFAQLKKLSRDLPSPAPLKGWRKVVTLASGQPGPVSFEDGAEYAQALAAQARDEAAAAMAADVKAVRDLIDAHDDADELREALTKHYAGMDPTALTELTRRAILLAELAGRLAVAEEVLDAVPGAEQ